MRALLQQRTLKQNRGKTKSEEEDRTWYILLHDGKSCIKRMKSTSIIMKKDAV